MGVCRICYCGVLNRNCLCPSRAERLHGIGVQGPAQGPLVGSRGNAPAGVQGAELPEAPGFSGFLRPQNASPCIVFLSFLRQVFLQNPLI